MQKLGDEWAIGVQFNAASTSGEASDADVGIMIADALAPLALSRIHVWRCAAVRENGVLPCLTPRALRCKSLSRGTM